MKKWNLIIDVEKCESCNNCFLACKDEHVDNSFPGYSVQQPVHGHRWIKIKKKERGQFPNIDVSYLPKPCFHCDDAPCVAASKDGAVYKRKDGIVIIDPVKAVGQTGIVKSCPYNAIWWNEKQNTAQKCTLCAHLLDDGWKEPRCVSVCPTGALRIVHEEDAKTEELIKKEGLQVYKPGPKAKPRVYYKNLYRFTDFFISGTVAATKNQIVDCIESVLVSLYNDSGEKLAETLTDIFGDFKFDQLGTKPASYQLNFQHDEFGKKELKVELTESKFVGTVML